ncbi:S8 family serine peptidase [Streptomyces pinistramenti]|uniref:S8 family serine peptidase n=1 Tax=Streptomyces pinistramenti TaxID=2884812 RepID=UPI001D095217|nr:S8 family serine peptidase [Streptomyces pinistramenti]MCB5909309.1 S8 family serine peptidase [Streptomyces pinistramenti]
MSFTRKLRVVGGAVVAGALLFGTAPVASADQIRDAQWPLKAFDAEKIWNLSTGKGVTVAVIDDGVNSQHPDLKGNVLPGKDFMDGGSAEPENGDTHGTQMASEIAGHGHGPGGESGVKGLAPDAKILPLRDKGGNEDGFSSSIRYAVDKGASVINISQGGSSADGEQAAIAYALQHNVLIVTASGNDGKGPEGIGYPGSYHGVLTVGGVQNTGEIWPKSNYGPQVLLTAPAVDIISAGGSGSSLYQKGTGTSDSTAFVSGAAALLRAKFPDLTPGQIVNRLTKTAGLPDSAKGTSLPDQKYGYGFIQPLAALKRDIPAGSKNGPLTMPKVDSSPSAGDSTGSQGTDDKGGSSQAVEKAGVSPLFIGLIVVAVLVVLGIILVIVLVARRKGRRNGPPPGGPGGFGGPGGPGFAPQQPGPYQQQAGPPGQYPPPPGQYPAPPGR